MYSVIDINVCLRSVLALFVVLFVLLFVLLFVSLFVSFVSKLGFILE